MSRSVPDNAVCKLVRFSVFALIAAIVCPVASFADADGGKVFGQIAAAVTAEIDACHIPGAVVLVGEHGRVVYRAAFGASRVQPDRAAMSAETIFDLASLTKVVATTTAVMQLVDAKRLALDAPVARYWPGFAQHGKAAITVRELLTHSSGLRPDFDGRDRWAGPLAARLKVEAEHPIYPPGARFLYSDINFIALGELVERVTGQSLDRYAARHIFAPLGMKDTGFRPAASLRLRIAPTDIENGELRWGDVQDPTAKRMGGVAGHAGLFGTADDLAIFAQMLLKGGSLNGKRILSSAAVASMTTANPLPGNVLRGLGWDVQSPYGGGQDTAFGLGSYGHTGYTGTSLWIDPKHDAYLIILTSRLHPNGRGDVKPLRQNLAQIVAAATETRVATGIDVLEGEKFAPLVGRQIGLLTNQTGRDAFGRRTIDVLAHAPGVHLAALFSPEHGLGGDREGKIASSTEAATGVPVYSLYGSDLHPAPATLAQLDALVIDLQDVGVRFYTYATTMAYALEAAAHANLPVFVLDRPDPITASIVAGPVLDKSRPSFTGYFPMPVQHGMTLGELARMFNTERNIGAQLTIVSMRSYRRDMWFDDTGLSWINPSPNLRSIEETVLYPGVALVEGANVSVGRGTSEPFNLVGAPWIDGQTLATELRKRDIPGVRFESAAFTPSEDRYANTLCHGVRITVTDRKSLDAPELGIELAAALHRLYPKDFRLDETLGLIGSRETLHALEAGIDPREIAREWQTELQAFSNLRAKYLIY
jgi:uncharacterized protein YbbC (DUF1343 family)/CubicO group peptidase (beta-lactamase class C family)